MCNNVNNVVRSALETLGIEPTEDEFTTIAEGYRSIITSMAALHEIEDGGIEPLTVPRLPMKMGSTDAWAG